MSIFNLIKKIIVLIIITIFVSIGLIIFITGTIMILDATGLINAPFSYEGGINVAIIYTCAGLAWSAFMFMTIIRNYKRKK